MKCEACERNNVEIAEPCDDPNEPYRICNPCYQRLHARALRPLEWYNLAKRHGWYQHLLHDDFYDEDGNADQPEERVEHPERYPAPTLELAMQDAELLLDYSITRWNFSHELVNAWSAFPKSEVLVTIKNRFETTRNAGIRDRILEICASCLAERGMEFVRTAWSHYPNELALPSLAEASAACLPYREGYDRVIEALERLDGKHKRNLMFTLGYFRSAETLDWIEENISDPISDSWGYLSAASTADWARLKAWIDEGRPLSLVAIDALRAYQQLPTPMLKKRGIRIATPPTREELTIVLEEYADRDPVPRVRQRIDSILHNYELLNNRK